MNTVLAASIRLVVSKTEKIWKQIWKKLEKIFRSELQTFDRLFFQIQKSGNFFLRLRSLKALLIFTMQKYLFDHLRLDESANFAN